MLIGQKYIGQTGRLIRKRLHGYVRVVKNIEILGSGVAKHFHSTNRRTEFEEAQILIKTSNNRERVIREAIEIVQHPNDFKRKHGYKFSKLWTSAIPL